MKPIRLFSNELQQLRKDTYKKLALIGFDRGQGLALELFEMLLPAWVDNVKDDSRPKEAFDILKDYRNNNIEKKYLLKSYQISKQALHQMRSKFSAWVVYDEYSYHAEQFAHGLTLLIESNLYTDLKDLNLQMSFNKAIMAISTDEQEKEFRKIISK